MGKIFILCLRSSATYLMILFGRLVPLCPGGCPCTHDQGLIKLQWSYWRYEACISWWPHSLLWLPGTLRQIWHKS